MLLKHRITSLGFLLVFLSAWVPSSLAHAIDPHHDEVATTQTTLHESDHCPYCDLNLSAFTHFQPSFFSVTTALVEFDYAVYIPDFSVEETSLLPSRGPPAC